MGLTTKSTVLWKVLACLNSGEVMRPIYDDRELQSVLSTSWYFGLTLEV